MASKIKKIKKKISEKKRLKKRKKNKIQNRLSLIKSKHGKKIYEAMMEENIDGNYKDYVLLINDDLIDWQRTAKIVTDDENKAPLRVKGVQLVHKRKLKNIIGVAAQQFWGPNGRVSLVPPATKPKE